MVFCLNEISFNFHLKKRQGCVSRGIHTGLAHSLCVGLQEPMYRKVMNGEGTIIRENMYVPGSHVDSTERTLK